MSGSVDGRSVHSVMSSDQTPCNTLKLDHQHWNRDNCGFTISRIERDTAEWTKLQITNAQSDMDLNPDSDFKSGKLCAVPFNTGEDRVYPIKVAVGQPVGHLPMRSTGGIY